MAVVQSHTMSDMLISTLYKLGRPKFQQIAQSATDYEIFSHWFREGRVIFESDGIGISRTLMDRTRKVAKHAGLTDPDEVNLYDFLRQLKVEFVQVDTHWTYIRQNVIKNAGESLITKLIEPKRANALISLAEELEEAGWDAPTVAEVHRPKGVAYWIVQNATEGFNGGYPEDHTSLSGIDLAQSPHFKNYTDTYAAYTASDLVKTLKKAHRKIRFKSPVSINDFRRGRGDQYRIYGDGTFVDAMEDIAEAQNQSLGYDVASTAVSNVGRSTGMRFVDNVITFRGHPIRWVEELDNRANSPVYMIDHSTFYPVALKQDYLFEHDPEKLPKQHRVFVVFIDLSYNYICVDRRRNAVFYKV